MRSPQVLLLSGALFVLLSACTDQRESNVHQSLEQQVATQSGGALVLSSFTKTNGYEQNLAGMKLYTLEWQAQLAVQRDVWKNGNGIVGYWENFSVMSAQPDTYTRLMFASSPMRLAKGTVVALQGESHLQQTEKGWRILDVTVKGARVLSSAAAPAEDRPKREPQSVSSEGDMAARNQAIEAALTGKLPMLELHTGFALTLSGADLTRTKTAVAAGLLEVPYLPNARELYVVATPKLLGIAANASNLWTKKDQDNFLGGESETPTEYRRRTERSMARIKLANAKLDKVFTDEDYTGALATPGEKHRLVLGAFKSSPAAAAQVVGPSLATAKETSLRFRCVLRYSDVKKAWTVLACDLGSIDPETWFGRTVK